MTSLKKTLIERDGISKDEADELIAEARANLMVALDEEDFEMAYNTCEIFSLEPDYLEDLI